MIFHNPIVTLKLSLMILIFSLPSCDNNEGEWGATVGNCDEVCTVYYTAQRKLRKDYSTRHLIFPDKKERRDHVIKTNSGHRIKSWFNFIDNDQNLVKNKFSCEVYYSSSEINYVVKNLKVTQ